MIKPSIKTQYYLGAAIILIISCVGISWYQYRNLQNQAVTSVYRKTEIYLAAASSIRAYVMEVLRPRIRESVTSDQFILEAMSTSYVSRKIMGYLKQSYPEFNYKRTAFNPRNPLNQADEFEEEMLTWFSNNPEEAQWGGMIRKGGRAFYARMTPIWAEEDCLVCHGSPADAPRELIERYGADRSYGFFVGDIVGADTIYIPMDSTNLLIKEKTARVFLFGFISLFSLFALFALLFNRTVVQQLKRILKTFKSIYYEGQQDLAEPDFRPGDEFYQIKTAFEDVATSLKTMHDELKRSETKYRTLFQASPDAIFVSDKTGKLTDLNQAGMLLFDLEGSGGQPSRISFEDLFIIKEEGRMLFSRIKDSTTFIRAECAMITGSGKNIICLISANRLLNEANEFVGIEGVCRDVTEEKKLANHLAQAEKMASIGQLAAGVAHEINNPLGVILCYGDLILKNADTTDQISEDARVIRKHADSCKTIVESLLNFSRVADTQMKKADIHDCLLEILSVLQNQMKKQNITVQVNLDQGMEKILFDEDKIKQVFMNLLLNAMQAMPEGGDLSLSTRYSIDKKQIMIDITDSGCGVPEEKLDKIFEPFYTTKKRGEGTGLGLSVSYGIIQQHNGYISVSSQPDHGTTFSILLPVDGNRSLTRLTQALS